MSISPLSVIPVGKDTRVLHIGLGCKPAASKTDYTITKNWENWPDWALRHGMFIPNMVFS